MGAEGPSAKKAKRASERLATPDPPASSWSSSAGDSLGGLYDFLPPPDPENDALAKAAAAKNHLARPPLPPENRSMVIFLDVDGVLLATGSVETITIDGVAMPTRDTVKETDFGVSACGSLRSIVQQTGATIVLSSEWRRTSSLRSSIAAVLKSYDVPNLRDVTPIFTPRAELMENPVFAWCERRAREIGKWLKDHPEVTSWVALDDLNFEWADSFRLPGTPWMKIRSVHCNDKIGLTEDGAAQAVRILQNPPPEPKQPVKRKAVDSQASSGLLCSTEDSPDRLRLG